MTSRDRQGVTPAPREVRFGRRRRRRTKAAGGTVAPSDGATLSAGELRDRYDAAWARVHERDGYVRILELVGSGVELSLGDLRVGPRLAGAVARAADPALELRDRLRRAAGASRAALAERLRPHATDLRSRPAASARKSGPKLSRWTPSQVKALPIDAVRALQLGPIVAALLVAAADGSIDGAEATAFRDWIDRRVSGPTATLFPGGAAEAGAVLNAMLVQRAEPARLLGVALAALRQEVEPPARSIYAGEIRELALHVAQSSSGGGWFSFLRPRVSAEEQQALDLLDALLARITAE